MKKKIRARRAHIRSLSCVNRGCTERQAQSAIRSIAFEIEAKQVELPRLSVTQVFRLFKVDEQGIILRCETFEMDRYVLYDLIAPFYTRPEARPELKISYCAVREMIRVLREPYRPCTRRGFWPRERQRPFPVILVMDAALHRLAHSREIFNPKRKSLT